jgi:hypothetical protein
MRACLNATRPSGDVVPNGIGGGGGGGVRRRMISSRRADMLMGLTCVSVDGRRDVVVSEKDVILVN